VISCSNVTKRQIRFHYDLSTLFYRLLWGRHIHHGLWEANESTQVAQQRLTETLASLAQVKAGNLILDVGCGMGGSSMHLAHLGCQVTGVTLSPIQRRWAGVESWCRGLSRKIHWQCADAESLAFHAKSFDVVWSIECTEHLFDKPAFFRRAAQWLKPGGRMAICAWLAGEHTDAVSVRKVMDVCEGFLCPSLGTSADYRNWFTDAGLVVEQDLDWTSQVQQTWEICHRRVRRWGIRHLARWIDRDTVQFLDRFPTILEAYQDGSMKYGCFIAKMPD
jgi:tocopherol O-methyltransferase